MTIEDHILVNFASMPLYLTFCMKVSQTERSIGAKHRRFILYESYSWKKRIRQSERSSKWRSIMVFELEVNDKNDHKAVHFHKKDRSLLSWLLICQSDPNGRLRKIFLANFKMMGWDRLKIWEWVKDALAISKIRIDFWFTRLSIGRFNNTFLDLIIFYYTNIIESFPLYEHSPKWRVMYQTGRSLTIVSDSSLIVNDRPVWLKSVHFCNTVHVCG